MSTTNIDIINIIISISVTIVITTCGTCFSLFAPPGFERLVSWTQGREQQSPPLIHKPHTLIHMVGVQCSTNKPD